MLLATARQPDSVSPRLATRVGSLRAKLSGHLTSEVTSEKDADGWMHALPESLLDFRTEACRAGCHYFSTPRDVSSQTKRSTPRKVPQIPYSVIRRSLLQRAHRNLPPTPVAKE
jgi:hypothetical protein